MLLCGRELHVVFCMTFDDMIRACENHEHYLIVDMRDLEPYDQVMIEKERRRRQREGNPYDRIFD